MHRLSEVRIQNYKSIKDLTLPLSNYTPLVGQNNTGKSNILEAIQWFLQPSGMDKEDFKNPDNEVVVTGKIEGIEQVLFKELDDKHQKQIENYIVNGTIIFRRIQLKPSGRKGDRELEVRDPEKKEDDPEAFRSAPTGLPEALNKLFPDSIFIRAMEDATKDISVNQSTTTIGRLISTLSDVLIEGNKEKLEDSIGVLEKLFSADSSERAEQLNDFDKKAKGVISDFFPGIELKLHIPPPTLDDILKNGTVQIHEGDNELRDFEALGHGAQRSIQMAMIRLLREFSSGVESGARKFLLIEEPELYLHPTAIHILRNALKELSDLKFQVLFATHSPIIIMRDDIPDTILIRKSSEGTYRLKSIRELVKKMIKDHDSQADLLFSLTNSSKILFSNTVLLMEGKTEKNVIPVIVEKVSKALKKDREVAFVPMNGGGGIAKAAKILKAMDLKTLSIVDLDFCFREAAKKGIIEESDEDLSGFSDSLGEICSKKGIALADDGFPMKNDNYSASEAFTELAKEEALKPYLNNLQEKLSSKGYWLWRTGDIEETLGLESKGKYETFLHSINKAEDWKTEVNKADEVEEFVNWLNEY